MKKYLLLNSTPRREVVLGRGAMEV